eukprot:IDg6654t1
MLQSCIRFSNCHNGDDKGMNRWNLMDDFVTDINEYRSELVRSSDLICVDESISNWYGLGGDLIDIYLRTNRAIDRNPGNGCKMKTNACGRRGMLQLEIVRSSEGASRRDQFENIIRETAITQCFVDI